MMKNSIAFMALFFKIQGISQKEVEHLATQEIYSSKTE